MARGSAVFVWSDRALFIGDRSETAVHGHHATEISLALDDRGLDVATPSGPTLRGVAGAVVRADAAHRLVVHGAKVAVLYLDAHSPWGAGIERWLASVSLAALPEGVVEARRARLHGLFADQGLAEADAVIAELIGALVPIVGVRPGDGATGAVVVDPRIRRALELLDRRLDDPPSQAEVASHVGLSASRFGHLFPRQVGLPMRRYVLWMRLRAALIEALASGDMTTAAVAAGFADHAHFTRTCRRMFGLPPTAFAPVDAVLVAPRT